VKGGNPVNVKVNHSARETILATARRVAQAHGYGGLNFRDIAEEVGIKAASVYYHFPSKADLGAAVAQRYWQDTKEELEGLSLAGDASAALRRYPDIFRRSLENSNSLCLCSFMSAEYDDLPDSVKSEIQVFSDVNVAWLGKELDAAGVVPREKSVKRARAIFAAISGAQLMARSRSDIALFDALISSYREAGLVPA